MTEDHYAPRVYRLGDVLINVNRRRVERNGHNLKITDKPFDLLSFMLAESWKNPNRQISNSEIVTAIWPDEPATTAGTINRHTANIRQALGIDCIKGTRNSHVLIGPVEDATPLEPEFLVANRIVVACTTAVIFTMLATLPSRTILGTLGFTLTEPLFSAQHLGLAAILGWFQGMIGALGWSVPISAALLFQWFVVDKFNPWEGKTPFLKASVIGTFAGLAGGMLIDLGLLFAQSLETLLGAGWILSRQDSRWTAFTSTRIAYAELSLGAVIGCTCGLTIMSVVRQNRWRVLLSSPGKIENLEGTLRAFRIISIEAARRGSILILVPMLGAGFVCYLFLRDQSPHLLRYLGEAFSIGFSGVAFVTGLLFGLLVLTKGFEITGKDKCSLSPALKPAKQARAAKA